MGVVFVGGSHAQAHGAAEMHRGHFPLCCQQARRPEIAAMQVPASSHGTFGQQEFISEFHPWSWESKVTPPVPAPPRNKALLRDY